MSASVKQILEEFQLLTPGDQREAAAAILRGLAELDYPRLEDEALSQIADESFKEYDAYEARQGEG